MEVKAASPEYIKDTLLEGYWSYEISFKRPVLFTVQNPPSLTEDPDLIELLFQSNMPFNWM